MGSFFCFRLATVVVSAALMTLATSPMQLTNGLERLFNPAKRIGLPVAELALMISITLRFIPVRRRGRAPAKGTGRTRCGIWRSSSPQGAQPTPFAHSPFCIRL